MRAALVVFVFGLLVSTSSRAAATMMPTDIRLQDGFAIPAPTGLEARLIADAKDGVLSDVDLVSAALIASGVAEADIPAQAAELREGIATARAQARTQTSAKKRGDRLLRALHATVLRKYVESQSRVDVIAGTGEFNCLSSAVVFAIAADGLVDAPRGMLSTTHAFVRATVDGKPADVETTTAGGFAVDRRQLVTREFLRQRGVGEGMTEAALLKDLQSPEEVPLIGLVAALYSNRAVHAIRRGDVEGAAVAFDRSTKIATGQLKVRVANWRAGLLGNAAVGLLRSGRTAEARALLLVGIDGATGDTRTALVHNIAAVTIELANEARAAGRLREALGWLDEATRTGGVDAKTATSVATMRAELEGHLGNGDASRCAAITVGADKARCLSIAAEALLKAGQDEQALDVARAASALADVGVPLHYNSLVGVIARAQTAMDCPRVEVLVRELDQQRRRLPTPPPLQPARMMAQCSSKVGQQAVEAGRLDVAAAAFARASMFLDDPPELQHNRAVVELRMAQPHAEAGRCDDARPHVSRAIDLVTGSDDGLASSATRLLEYCANRRASEASKRQQWAVAVDELRRGLRDVPESAALRSNLIANLHNVAIVELKAGRCDEARALLPELRAANDAIVADIEGRCR